jgi:acetylornithine/succinyldiaminopimelate/putrescine aminotransferase
MTGLVVECPAKDVEKHLLCQGLISLATADRVVRFLPPLTVTEAEVREALVCVEKAAAEVNKELTAAMM